MCAKWRNGYDPHLLLNKIRPLVSLSQTGGLVTSSFSYIYRLKHVLLSAIEFEPGIPESELDSIVTDAVRDALQRKVFDAEKVKVAITRAEKKFLKKKPEPYIFATSISLREMPPFRKLSVDDHNVLFSKNLPKSFDRKEAEKRITHILPVPLPSDYIAVRVTCDGRSPTEAAEKARGAFGLMMGIWNLILTRGSTTISLSGTAGGPIASLRQGPLRTLHHEDGSLATSTIWYEPTYTKPAPVKDVNGGEKVKRVAV